MKFLYTICGTQFQVSFEDEIFLVGFNWRLTDKGYIEATTGKYKKQFLHRIIAERMGLDLSNEIDHEDRNKLNNQRSNLRSATHSQNQMNSKLQSNNTSGIKGVHWHKIRQKWCAQISINGKTKHLGYFETLKEASKIRKEAAMVHHKEFTRFE